MNYGIDFLGGARYQKTVLAEHPRAFGFGCFAEVDGFGKAYDLIEKVAALGVPFIRVQMMWKDNHQFTPQDVKVVQQRFAKLFPIMKKYPSIKWYVSPCCEHMLSESQFEPFAEAVMNIGSFALGVEVVNSPIHGKGHHSKKYINEFHGADKNPKGSRYAFSFDGTQCVDSDIETYKNNYANAEYFMLWNSQCNGNRKVFTSDKERGPKDYKDRSKRIYWPTPKQIDSWIYLTTHNKGNTKIPKGWIFKSHSDQHSMPPEGKDQKPCWVKLPKFKAIEVRAVNGQLIDKAPYFGTYQGGGHRYYHSDYGYILAEKAYRIQGMGVCNVFGDGKKVGQINLAFRDGVYR